MKTSIPTRRIWKIESAGQIKNLRLQQEPLPLLESHKIRIQVRAVGLNFADIFALTGLYSATPKGPFIPGLEFSGVIMDTGSQVTQWQMGDQVMGLIRFGAYADIVDTDAWSCLPLPPGWSFEEGAAFVVQTFTAWYGLVSLGNVQAGQNVLIHSAAGGVGLQAMKIVQILQANPIGTVGHSQKQHFLQTQGFEQVLLRTSSFPRDLKKLLGERPLHLVLDAIGGDMQTHSYAALSPMGRLVVFGAAEFTPGTNHPRYLKMLWSYLRRPTYDPLDMMSDNKSVMGFNLIWLWQEAELFHDIFSQVKLLNLTPPLVGHIFPFEQALDALETLRGGQSIGKVVLHVTS